MKRPDPLHGLGRALPRAAARGPRPPLRRLPGGHPARPGPRRLRVGEGPGGGGRARRHLPRGQALAHGLDGAGAARGGGAARPRDGRAPRSRHDPRRLPRLAVLPGAAGAGQDPRPLPRPHRSRRPTARCPRRRRPRPCSTSCGGAWSAPSCPASRPTAGSRPSTGRPPPGRASSRRCPPWPSPFSSSGRRGRSPRCGRPTPTSRYLLLDLLVLPQRRLTKWIRNGSAVAFVLVYGGVGAARAGPSRPARAGGAPRRPGRGRLPLPLRARPPRPRLRPRPRGARPLLELGALYLAPTPLGPHVALPLFCAAFAWEERTVFWRYTAPILLAYATLVPPWLGGGVELLPHAIAGLVAWGVARFLPRGGGAASTADEEPDEASSSTLGLRD